MFFFFFLRKTELGSTVSPTLPSLRWGCTHLIHIKPRERGFNGGNFSHGPDVHHTRERAGLEPFYVLPERTIWKRHWDSNSNNLQRLNHWKNRGLLAGWLTRSTLKTKLCLNHRSCSQGAQQGCSWWSHKSAEETTRKLSTSARSPVQNATLWQCQFK